MDMVFPTMAPREEEEKEREEASLGEFAWKSRGRRDQCRLLVLGFGSKKREKGCLKMVLQGMDEFS